MTPVEVCGICDIAGCHHIRERKADAGLSGTLPDATSALDALVERAQDDAKWMPACSGADTLALCAAAITTLRAQLAETRAERGAMIHPDHVEGLVKLAEPMLYEALAAETIRADRAEAALAAQIEVDAAICTDIMSYDCMKADGETYQPMWVQKVAKGMVSLARQDIRNQPHDRTALDRYREKVLREAAAVELQYFDEDGNMSMRKLPFRIKNAILALIEKGKTE